LRRRRPLPAAVPPLRAADRAARSLAVGRSAGAHRPATDRPHDPQPVQLKGEGPVMALTPVELRQIKPSRSLFGYNRRFVHELLDAVVDSFEVVWRERADLADKVERLEEDLVRYRELETLLRTTLVSAERASQELREQARREAQVLLEEAHAEARGIRREAL